jgi:hypothetical protein
MAKVTITIEDGDENENSVTMRIESDPAWPGPAAEDQSMTPAQSAGLRFFDWMRKEHPDEEPDVEGE